MQAHQEKQIKVLLCQLKPILKQKKQNIDRISKSLELYSHKDNIDVILFPEMAFTGYNFENQHHAMSEAVKYSDLGSLDFQFAVRLAKKNKAYVMFGYMEKDVQNGNVVLYNSAAVIDRQGVPILNYRKTHLFFNDELWCKPGTGFVDFEITNTKGQVFKTVLGICMDINPKNFTSGQYEWADFAVSKKAELLFFLTNWVDSQEDSVKDESVIAMYDYWLHRMRPLVSMKNPKIAKDPVLFFAADRVGREYSYFDKKQCQFFGSSCGIHINPPYLIQKLSKLDQGYLMIQSKLPIKP